MHRSSLGLVLFTILQAQASGYQAPLTSNHSWTDDGGQAGARFGHSVASAGDVNGDGFDDVIIGAVELNGGAAFVYLGSPTGLSSTPHWMTESTQTLAHFGFAVAAAGDVNGDGYDDVIVGAPLHENGENSEGGAFLYMGSPGGLTDQQADWFVDIDQPSAHFGYSVSGVGDVNGDGFDDVLIGALLYDNGELDEGGAFLYLGSSSGLSTLHVWSAEGNQIDARFGQDVAGAGDVNGDGYADVIIGAYKYSAGETLEGRASLFLGSPSGLSMNADWTAESNQDFASFGISVSAAGDVNGDGFDDLIIGAETYDGSLPDEGAAFLYFGSSSLPLLPAGWVTVGGQAGAHYGYSVASAGDVNSDGYDDVVVGAYLYEGTQMDEGAALLYLGSPSGLKQSPCWTSLGAQLQAEFGASVAGAGDVDGDGFADVLVGSAFADNPTSNEGRAFLYSGQPSSICPQSFCFGDGIDRSCKCDNNDTANVRTGGCLNSNGTGAVLTTNGDVSLGSNSLTFDLIGGVPTALAVLTSGDNVLGGGVGILGMPESDGLRCAGSNLLRHGSRALGITGANSSPWGTPLSGPPGGIVANAGFVVGQTRHFQVRYRENSLVGPCGFGTNTTQAIELTFAP